MNKHLTERICKLCNSGVVEDEIHFLCDCPIYSEERRNLYSKAINSNNTFENLDSFDKFVYLMGNHERAVISFLPKAVPKRRHHLYSVLDN